jgi:hypothetical protein
MTSHIVNTVSGGGDEVTAVQGQQLRYGSPDTVTPFLPSEVFERGEHLDRLFVLKLAPGEDWMRAFAI